MRLVLTYPELPIPDHRDVVGARWLVRPEDEEQIGQNRFEWIGKFARLWTPLIVLPGQEASHHVVFEKRWEQEVVAEAVRARLEVVTDSSDGWVLVGGWEFPLHEPLWGDMLRTGVMSAMIDDEFEDADDTHSPDDLHKYLRPDGDVSTEGKLGHRVVQDLPEARDD